ncbi:hypothetical protein [Haloglomus litoreum]|uniref:hypothetical protein n=1 Tax=Haloglomus litoreum TaxID=3034026 RepID=UPI0023E83866|nr:hypothetical protein [Haloglomus sp. DT116]
MAVVGLVRSSSLVESGGSLVAAVFNARKKALVGGGISGGMDRRRVLALIAATTGAGCQEQLFGGTPELPRGSISLVELDGPSPSGYEGRVNIRRSRFDSDGPALLELRLRNTGEESLPFDRFNDYPLGLVFPDDYDGTNLALLGTERVDGLCWRTATKPLLTDTISDDTLHPGEEIGSLRELHSYILQSSAPESNSDTCLPPGEYTFSRFRPDWSFTLELSHEEVR